MSNYRKFCTERDGRLLFPIILGVDGFQHKIEQLRDVLSNETGYSDVRVDYNSTTQFLFNPFAQSKNVNSFESVTINCFELGLRIVVNTEKIVSSHNTKDTDYPSCVREIPFKTDDYTLGKIKILEIDITFLTEQIVMAKDKLSAAKKLQMIKREEKKLNNLFLAGEVTMLGFPSENVATINTTVEISLPNKRKNNSTTKNKIRLELPESRKKKTAEVITDNTNINISFLQESNTRKTKVCDLQVLPLSEVKIILESFKKVYFKEEHNEQDETDTNQTDK